MKGFVPYVSLYVVNRVLTHAPQVMIRSRFSKFSVPVSCGPAVWEAFWLSLQPYTVFSARGVTGGSSGWALPLTWAASPTVLKGPS